MSCCSRCRSQCFVVCNAVYRIKFHSVFVEVHDIKEIKFPIGNPYKILYYVMYGKTQNFTATITVGRLWKLPRVSEHCVSERTDLGESVYAENNFAIGILFW